jgi:hypothetical protein
VVGARPDFENGAAVAILVVFHWEALEEGIAGGA